MAYRESHYRRGYYRRTPSGGITWVSPTIVSGYYYEPGTIDNHGHFSGFTYIDDDDEIVPTINESQISIIEQICRLFSNLDSENRKQCLDILETYDTQLDEKYRESTPEVNQSTITDENVPQNTGINDFKLTFLPNHTYRIEKFINNKQKSIIVPESINGIKVTQISAYAFANSTDLQYIILPNTLEFIGQKAFYESSIQTIIIPEKVSYIGDYCFSCCNHLTNVEIKSTTLGNYMFYKCDSLTSVELSETITDIGDYSFSCCNRLSSIEIKSKIVGKHMFYNCTSLTTVKLSDSITQINKEAFAGTAIVGKIKIPSSCTFIDFSAFARNADCAHIPLHIYIESLKFRIEEDNYRNLHIDRNTIVYYKPKSIARMYVKLLNIRNKQFEAEDADPFHK